MMRRILLLPAALLLASACHDGTYEPAKASGPEDPLLAESPAADDETPWRDARDAEPAANGTTDSPIGKPGGATTTPDSTVDGITPEATVVDSSAVASTLAQTMALLMPNVGQFASGVSFVLRHDNVSIAFGDDGFTFYAQGVGETRTSHLQFVGGTPTEALAGEPRGGVVNFLVGPTDRWRTAVPTYDKLTYKGVWPGIDVVYDLKPTGLEYSLVVAPGADLTQARFKYTNAVLPKLTASGGIEFPIEGGLLTESKPIAFFAGNGKRVSCKFTLHTDGSFGFESSSDNFSETVIIDPAIKYTSFLGGGWGGPGGASTVTDLAVDDMERVYVTGTTSGNYPTTAGVYDRERQGTSDIFVSALAADGSTLLWSTLLGGSDEEDAPSLAVHSSGSVLVAGVTRSDDFPTTAGAIGQTSAGNSDMFVLELAANGATLAWSTLLGGSSQDEAASVAVDALGNVYVVGTTSSADFPTTPGAFIEAAVGQTDVFIARISNMGQSLDWSTLLGGTLSDSGADVAVTPSGDVVVVGGTSGGFPTTAGSYAPVTVNTADGFVTQLAADGASLVWSSYLGGDGSDEIVGVAVDSAGRATVAGTTYSSNFPITAGVAGTVRGGSADAFVTRFESDGASLVYSSLVGGADTDSCTDVSLTDAGAVILLGNTSSADFPMTLGAYDTDCCSTDTSYVLRISADATVVEWATAMHGGGSPVGAASSTGEMHIAGAASENVVTTPGSYSFLYREHTIYISKLNDAGSALLWSTFLDESSVDTIEDVAVDSAGDVYLTGSTTSGMFPSTAGSFDETHGGGSDAFVVRITDRGTRMSWATFLGGSGNDGGLGIAVDSTGNVAFAGVTMSADFPTSPGAFTQEGADTQDAVVVSLSPSGTLNWTARFGGNAGDVADSVAIGSDDSVYMCGATESTDYPTSAGVLQPALGGGWDVVLARLSTTGSLTWSTHVGGTGTDSCRALQIGPADAVQFGGTTNGFFFVTPPPPPDTDAEKATLIAIIPTSSMQGFVAQVDSNGSSRDWSQLLMSLGATGVVTALAQGDLGEVYVAGASTGNFMGITPFSAQPNFLGGLIDGFVVKLDAPHTGIEWGTYVGGPGIDIVTDMEVDGGGNLVLSGRGLPYAAISTLPPPPAGDKRGQEKITAVELAIIGALGAFAISYPFVTKLNPLGTGFTELHLLNTSTDPLITAIAITPAEDIYVVGSSNGSNLSAAPGSLQESAGGAGDGFIVVIGDSPVGMPVHGLPFNSSRHADTTPTMYFVAAHATDQDIGYQVEWGTSPTLASGYANISASEEDFANVSNPADVGPMFNSGELISYTISDLLPLAQGTTYWWRVRAHDANGTHGPHSAVTSFTVDDQVPDMDWHQTTHTQFVIGDQVNTAVNSGAEAVTATPFSLVPQTIAAGPTASEPATTFNNAVNGFVDDSSFATTDNNSSGQAVYYNFALGDFGTTVPVGIEVAVDAFKIGGRAISVEVSLSSDAGTTYSAVYAQSLTNAADGGPQLVFGGPQDLWGRTWTAADLSEGPFRMRVAMTVLGGGSPTVCYLDAASVKVFSLDRAARTITSPLITLADYPPGALWSTATWAQDTAGGAITVEVLDEAGAPTGLSSSTNGASPLGFIDITTLTAPAVKLRASFDDLWTGTMPSLLDWTVAAGNARPVAIAGVDQNAAEGDTVVLDGTSSSDLDADPLSYAWIQLSGTAVSLSDSTAAAPSFPAPTVFLDESLSFQLIVNDSFTDSLPDVVVIDIANTLNEAPVAVPGPDATWNEDAAIALNGSASYDVNGDSITYLWTQVSGPLVSISSATVASPSITLLSPVVINTTLVFSLKVRDVLVDSAPVTVTLTVLNSVNEAPVAMVAANQVLGEGAAAVINGAASADPNGDIITFEWQQTQGPPVTLLTPTSSAPSFTTPIVFQSTDLVFTLIVTDGQDFSAPVATTVTVNNTINEAPTASVGPDQSVNEGDSVVLSALGTTDVNNDALTYSWTQTAGEAVVLNGAQTQSPSFSAPTLYYSEDLVFTLVVNDGLVDAIPAESRVTVNNSINEAPVADAGPAQTVSQETAVTLQGTGSYDPNGEALTYSWAQTGGAVVALAGASTATASFVSPTTAVTDVLIFELTVSDSWGLASPVSAVAVTVNGAGNTIPVASAGVDQDVAEGSPVILDGSGSADGDGDTLTYAWIQQVGPAVALTGADSVSPGFDAPSVAVDTPLTFSLTVGDGLVSSAPQTVSVIVRNTVNDRPIAAAGAAQTVSEAATVTLDGSNSTDPNGDTLTYAWLQVSGQPVMLDNATAAAPQFQAPSVAMSEVISFELTVHDGTDPSLPQQVNITVSNTSNEPPTANAGSDQSVNEDVAVSLDGGLSLDPNGDALSYAWAQQSGTPVVLSNAGSTTATFTSPSVTVTETLVFSLVTNDGGADSAPDLVNITVNNNRNEAPTAHAGADQSVGEGVMVTLDGSGSADPNNDVLGYAWIQTGGPTVTLSLPGAIGTTFMAPSVNTATDLLFELTVDDGRDTSPADEVIISIANTINQRPVADAGADLVVDELALVQLSGSGSTDIDGDSLTYAWLQLSGPQIVLDDPSAMMASFRAPAVYTQTDIILQLTVSDGGLDAAPATVSVTILNVINEAPIADAGPDMTINEDGSAIIDAAASYDPNDDPITFTWLQLEGPLVILAQTGVSRWSIAAPRIAADLDLVFELVVSDGALPSPADTLTIRVLNTVNEPPVAQAGPGQIVGENTTISLSGLASSDANGDSLLYSWTQTEGPTAVIDDPTSATPQVTLDDVFADTTLTFELVVTDGMDSSAPAPVTVMVVNSVNELPVADAGASLLVSPGGTVVLDGSGTYDVNNETLTYLWTQVSGDSVTLSDADQATASFVAPAPETPMFLEFELRVTDGHGATTVSRVSFEVAAAIGPPLIISRPRLVTFVGEAYAYDADSTIDVGGTPPMDMVLVSGPPGMIVHTGSGLVEWTPSAPGSFAIEIEVSNSAGTATQSFTVRVFGTPKITSEPDVHFLVGAPYLYDGESISGPSAVGSQPMVWTLESGPTDMVIDRLSGEIRWSSVSVAPQDVTIRASNAFGYDEQSFTVARNNNGEPFIEPTGNVHGAFEVAYVFDEDNRVSVGNLLDGEVLLVTVANGPPGFTVHPVSHRVVWRPKAVRDVDVLLQLETATGEVLGHYAYTISIVETGSDAAEAIAKATPQSGVAPLQVTFDASASTGTDGSSILYYRWDMADDHIIETKEAITSHMYTKPGRYLPVLTVTDVFGLSHSDKVEVVVQTLENMPPIARMRAEVLTGQDALTVRFNCDCSDPDGELRSLEWNFGDGEMTSLEAPVHTYALPGTYRARVTARDSAGLPASDSIEVVISGGERVAPGIQIQATPSSGDSPLRVELTVSSRGLSGEPRYTWRFDDQNSQIGEKVLRTYVDAGYFSVVVDMEVEDEEGYTLRAHDARTIYVSQDGLQPPRIVSNPERFAIVGHPYAYDTDMRPTAQGDRPLVWRLGRSIDGVTSGAPEGMAIDLDTGEIAWVPTNGQLGDHTIVLLAENDVNVDAQEFVVHVEAGPDEIVAADGCGCTAGKRGAGPLWGTMGLLGALMFLARRSRRSF